MSKTFLYRTNSTWLGIPETTDAVCNSPRLIGVSGDTELVRVALGTYLPAITTHTRYMMKAIFADKEGWGS